MSKYVATIEVEIEQGVDNMRELSIKGAAQAVDLARDEAEKPVDVSNAEVVRVERVEDDEDDE